MKKKIFISYQRQSQKQIEELAAALVQTGKYEVWYDQQLQSGQQWWDEIIRQIDLADVVILVLTPAYFTSDYCKREWQRAHDSKKILVPIKIDPALPFSEIPADISKWQVMAYDGAIGQFQKLDAAIQAAGRQSSAGLDRRVIYGGVVVVVLVVIVLLVVSQANKSGGEVTPPATSVAQGATSEMTSTTQPTPLPVPTGESGPFGLTLIYGGQDSFTVHIDSDSHLTGLTLETQAGVETLTDTFASLASAGFIGSMGTCLRYIREGTSPVLPRGCKKETTLEQILPGNEIFWYDDQANQYQDMVLKKDGVLVGFPCPHASGSGKCDYSR